MTETTDPRLRETGDLIGSDRVEGTAVRRSNGDALGRIERVMIGKRTGQVAYAVMTFGGFLGIGENFVPIPWSKLTYDDRLEAYVLDMSDEDLHRAPGAVEDGDATIDRLREEQMYDHYNLPPYWTT